MDRVGVLRLLAVGLLAAALGCAVAALVLVGSLDEFSFVPLPVMWGATVGLLAPADAWLRARGVAMPLRAVPLVLVGMVGLGAIAGLLSGGAPGGAVMGGVYGLVTAGCWAALAPLARGRG